MRKKKEDYKLRPDWEDTLRINGRYPTFLQAQKELVSTNYLNLKFYQGGDGSITGRVTKIYKQGEDESNDHSVVIEAANGKAYFIPLFRSPLLTTGGKKYTPLTEGITVTVDPVRNQKGRLTPEFKAVQPEGITRRLNF